MKDAIQFKVTVTAIIEREQTVDALDMAALVGVVNGLPAR